MTHFSEKRHPRLHSVRRKYTWLNTEQKVLKVPHPEVTHPKQLPTYQSERKRSFEELNARYHSNLTLAYNNNNG